MPLKMNLVQNHPSFTRLAYDTFIKDGLTEANRASERLKQKWLRDVGCFEENSFTEIINVTKSARIRMFQLPIQTY